MKKPLSIAVDIDSLQSLEQESRRYARELTAALRMFEAKLRLTNFGEGETDWDDFDPDGFEVFVTFNFDDASRSRYPTIPTVVVLDHLLPVGLKERVFDGWTKPEQEHYLRAIRSLADRECRIFTSSEWTRRDVLTWAGSPPSYVTALGAGVSSDFLSRRFTGTSRALTEKLGITSRYCMTWMGDEPFLGIELAYAAFIENRKHIPELELVICYETETEIVSRIREVSGRTGSHGIIFHGTGERAVIQELLTDAVCFLHPLAYDGFNLKILDAMHQACPIITTRSSSFPEAAADTALYAAPGDADELAKNIHAIATDAGVRSSLKNRTFLRSEAFRWVKVAEKMIGSLEEWLPHASKPFVNEVSPA